MSYSGTVYTEEISHHQYSKMFPTLPSSTTNLASGCFVPKCNTIGRSFARHSEGRHMTDQSPIRARLQTAASGVVFGGSHPDYLFHRHRDTATKNRAVAMMSDGNALAPLTRSASKLPAREAKGKDDTVAKISRQAAISTTDYARLAPVVQVWTRGAISIPCGVVEPIHRLKGEHGGVTDA